MEIHVGRELAALQRMTVPELRRRYAEVFGEATRGNNRVWLVKRVAWRLQALAEGDLSERARRRAEELANDADLRTTMPREREIGVEEASRVKTVRTQGDRRLPPPGTIITREYKGETLRVEVLAEGFSFEGRTYASLSAVAKAITGTHINGYLFFKMTGNGGTR